MSARIMRYLLLSSFAVVVFNLSVAVAAQPEPWQIGLQEPAGSIAQKATDLHNLLLVIITLISVFVLGLLVFVGWRFRRGSNPKPSILSIPNCHIRDVSEQTRGKKVNVQDLEYQ